jgi:hypothetical protein
MLSSSFAQKVEGTEVGFDGFFGASTNGGSFSIGAKYGFKFKEKFIAGPSLRFQRTWSKNPVAGFSSSFNIFGVGAFGHVRFANVLFAGIEFDMMRTPFAFSPGSVGPQWSPALFLGAGYSQEFNESFRINAGIMYDVIDQVNSPFRKGYFMRKENGVLIPLIYRITFFFVLS